MIKKNKTFFNKIYSLLFKRKIKYHDVSNFLNENDLFFDSWAQGRKFVKNLLKIKSML